MKRVLLLLLAICFCLALFSCDSDETNKEEGENVGEFSMQAVVKSVGDHIEVDVIKSEYASGIYWVLVLEDTVYFDKNGERIEKTDLKPDDTVEITYGGQVMMSYPPQIVAKSIKKI